jgi:uncharacterized protein YjiS (DUF1127 family)
MRQKRARELRDLARNIAEVKEIPYTTKLYRQVCRWYRENKKAVLELLKMSNKNSIQDKTIKLRKQH